MMNFDEGVAWLQSSALLGKIPDRVAVAWSGGADSTALLLALKASGQDVQAWHVDHAWRESSSVEAERLKKQAQEWDVAFKSVRLKLAPSSNREAAARKGRYQAFQQWAASSGVNTVCLGHHQDDQAETVCMRMLQGSGVMGCQGMRSMHVLNGLTLLRPLLHVSAGDIRRVLSMYHVPWFEDPSNADVSLWRNRIRLALFPHIRQQAYDPVALFCRWQEQASLVASKIETLVAQVELARDQYTCSVCWYQWCDLQISVRAYVLQAMVSKLFGEGVVAGRRHVLDVEAWTQRGGKGGLDLSRCRLMRQHGRLLLRRVHDDFIKL